MKIGQMLATFQCVSFLIRMHMKQTQYGRTKRSYVISGQKALRSHRCHTKVGELYYIEYHMIKFDLMQCDHV